MATKQEVIDTLQQALDLMNDSGAHWIQGALTNSGRTRYCSLGAVYQVTNVDIDEFLGATSAEQILSALEGGDVELRTQLVSALANAVPREHRNPGWMSSYQGQEWIITGYNDEDDRTWEEIVAFFERAKTYAEHGV